MKKDQNQELYQLEDELRDILSPYVVKTPSNEDTKQLISSLQSEFSKLQQDMTVEEEIALEKPSFSTQFKSQFSFYRWYFWVISIGIFFMLSLFTTSTNNDPEIVFLFSIPLSLLVGTLYTYQSWNSEMRMVESITPFPPALLVLSRLLIILAMNLAFGFVSSVYIGMNMAQLYFMPFLIYWIAPTFLVFGIFAFLFLMKGIKLAFGSSIVVWLALFIGDMTARNLQNRYPSILENATTIQLFLLLIGITLTAISVKKSYSIEEVKG